MYCKGMASGQLPEFITNDKWPPDSPEPWITMSGQDVGGLSQAPSKTQISHQIQRSVAGDLDSGTAFHKNRSTRLLRASRYDWRESQNWRWTIRAHKVQSDYQTPDIIVKYCYLKRKHFVVSVTMFCSVLVQTFFSTQKSLSEISNFVVFKGR